LVSSPKRAAGASAYGYQQLARNLAVVAVCRETVPKYNNSRGFGMTLPPNTRGKKGKLAFFNAKRPFDADFVAYL